MEKTIGFVNAVGIRIYENGEKLVPIKPICEALAVDYSSQLQRIKEDPILSLFVRLNPSIGKNGKTYQMQSLPIKYIFSWLIKINSRNVKEEAKEALVKYQKECYDLLYSYFTNYMDYVSK
jgi:hypothetical protein